MIKELNYKIHGLMSLKGDSMRKGKLIFISVVIVLLSLLLVFKNELKYLYYKNMTLIILKSNYIDANPKKIIIKKSNYVRNFYKPYSEVTFQINNKSYYAHIDLINKKIYDNYQYKKIYNDLSKEIISSFGKKYSKFKLEYGNKYFDEYPITSHHLTKGKYDGTNINKIIDDGYISLEFDTIDISDESIEKFVNKYKNNFDIRIECIENEKNNTDYNNPIPISKKCICDINNEFNCETNYRHDIGELSIIGEKEVVQRVSIDKIQPFSISEADGLYSYDYKPVSDYYRIKSSDPEDSVGIRLKGDFNSSKDYRFVIKRDSSYSFISDSNIYIEDGIVGYESIKLNDFIEIVVIEVNHKE